MEDGCDGKALRCGAGERHQQGYPQFAWGSRARVRVPYSKLGVGVGLCINRGREFMDIK
jgi:hypothetical protein